MQHLSISMKVIHIGIMRSSPDIQKPVMLCHAANLESFGFFQRNGVKEMLTTFSRIIVQRIRPGQRITVEQGLSMHKKIFPAAIGDDEAKPLDQVKVLDRSRRPSTRHWLLWRRRRVHGL